MSELVITNWKNHITAIGLIEDKVQYLNILDQSDRTGNVYVGRVENIVSNINSAFVRFENSHDKHGIGFLPLKNFPLENVLNKKATDISDIKAGDSLLVMIRTEEIKTKQARLTGKIKAASLKDFESVEELIGIARTRTDYQLISGKAQTISDAIEIAKEEFAAICSDEYKIISDIEFSEDVTDIEYYDEEAKRLPISVHYSLTSKTDDLFSRKVWLKSGAYLVIEQTETLNLIDVNSGKNIKKNEQLFLDINMEAAREAYRQIRLRNLSGMILIDFIDLNKEDEEKLTLYIKEIIKDDPCDFRFIDMTGLGIMEFTRNKTKKSLRESIDMKDM